MIGTFKPNKSLFPVANFDWICGENEGIALDPANGQPPPQQRGGPGFQFALTVKIRSQRMEVGQQNLPCGACPFEKGTCARAKLRLSILRSRPSNAEQAYFQKTCFGVQIKSIFLLIAYRPTTSASPTGPCVPAAALAQPCRSASSSPTPRAHPTAARRA
jgi:hypothetical protein